MRRRLAVLACTALSLSMAVGSAGARAKPAPESWAAPEIEIVVSAGLMATSSADFRPDEPLTQGELAIVLASLGLAQVNVTDPKRFVTMRELDARLVTALGLRPEARSLRDAIMQAGLAPTPWLGTETIARMLGLRVNHPREQEQLELQIKQTATRAEAAYSVARVLAITEYELEDVRQAADSFVSPWVTDWQQEVLRRALHFVGTPYVWAGTSERPQPLFGTVLPGGFDCSGFVYYLYGAVFGQKIPRMPHDMASEGMPVARSDLKRGDLVFFGYHGTFTHVGIYAGNGQFVHATHRGSPVMVTPLDSDYYRDRYMTAVRLSPR
jgi:cell wall-associated NlpC family hydrolase